MRRLILPLFALFFFATAAAAQRTLTFDDMMAIRRVGAPQPSPDGKWIAFDVSTIDLAANTRRSAIHLVPSTGGESKKITGGEKQDENPVWSPDGRTLAYVSNRDGGAKQVFLLDVATGTSRKLTDLANGAASLRWLPDGSGLLLVSDVDPECGVDPACTRERNAAAAQSPTKARIITGLLYRHWNAWQERTRTHIIHVPLSGTPRDLTPGAFDAPPFSVGGGDEFDVSPDGKELVYAQNTDEHPELSTNSDLFIVPTAGGEPKRITTRRGADTSPKYSPDGKWIAWRSQARAGYESDLWELWLHDRASGTSHRIAGDFPEWIDSVTWAPDSRSVYVTAPEKGRTAIYRITLDGRFARLFLGGSADALAVSRDGSTLYFESSTLKRPNEIFALAVGTPSQSGRRRVPKNGHPSAPRQITRENDALLGMIAMGEIEDHWWEGAGGAKVQGHLIKPPAFDPSKKYPAIVLVHGGPQGAWGDSWSFRWNPQMFAARGYVVFMPNPRGSTGFGQRFVEEISRDWGGRVYTDVMNGVDMLAAMPFVDSSRMGAAGASYGGYFMNWLLGHTDRFKALVSHAGVYNLESMYGVTEELWFPEWEFGGTPWNNPEQYEKWSPHRFAKNFRTPTLVTHGELDFRVPVGEGLQLFTALQRRGVPSKLLYFPDEGHWILKPQNSRLWYQTVLDWFDQWVK